MLIMILFFLQISEENINLGIFSFQKTEHEKPLEKQSIKYLEYWMYICSKNRCKFAVKGQGSVHSYYFEQNVAWKHALYRK